MFQRQIGRNQQFLQFEQLPQRADRLDGLVLALYVPAKGTDGR